MALQTSGAISLNDMHVEAGGTSGTEVSLNDADIRDLISKGAGAQARFSEWYGAAREYAFSIVDDVANADVRALAISDGWDGSEPLVVNVTSGTTVYSTTTSTGGMVVSGSFPNGITINNSGAITGRGGSAGQDGGDALEITTSDSVTVTNNSGAFIAGGGGGGASTGGGGGAGQSLPNTAGPAASSSNVTYSSCGSVTFGCSEGGTVTASCCGPSVATITYAAGGNQGAYAGSGGTTTGSSGSCVGSGTGGGPPPCTVSGVTINYGGVIVATGYGGTGGSILSATENVTNSGGGWGAAGTGSGAGAGGSAISGTYATLTNNGTIYGST